MASQNNNYSDSTMSAQTYLLVYAVDRSEAVGKETPITEAFKITYHSKNLLIHYNLSTGDQITASTAREETETLPRRMQTGRLESISTPRRYDK